MITVMYKKGSIYNADYEMITGSTPLEVGLKTLFEFDENPADNIVDISGALEFGYLSNWHLYQEIKETLNDIYAITDKDIIQELIQRTLE